MVRVLAGAWRGGVILVAWAAACLTGCGDSTTLHADGGDGVADARAGDSRVDSEAERPGDATVERTAEGVEDRALDPPADPIIDAPIESAPDLPSDAEVDVVVDAAVDPVVDAVVDPLVDAVVDVALDAIMDEPDDAFDDASDSAEEAGDGAAASDASAGEGPAVIAFVPCGDVGPALRVAFLGGPDRVLLEQKTGVGGFGPPEFLVLDANDGRVLRTLPVPGFDALAPDGGLLYVASDRSVRSTTDGSAVSTLAGAAALQGPSFSTDGTLVAGGFPDGSIVLWSTSTGSVVRTLTGHTGSVDSLNFSSDSARLISGSADGTAKVWTVSTGALVQTLVSTARVGGGAFTGPDSVATLGAGGATGYTVRRWTVSTGLETGSFSPPLFFGAFGLARDGSKVFGMDGPSGPFRQWNVSDGVEGPKLTGSKLCGGGLSYPPWTIEMSVPPDRFLSKRWGVAIGKTSDGSLERDPWPMGDGCYPGPIAFLPGGRLVSGERLWQMPNRQTLRLRAGYGLIRAAPDGSFLVQGSRGGPTVGVSDPTTDLILRSFPGAVDNLGISPDSTMIAIGATDSKVRIYRVSDGMLLRTLSGHTGAVHSVAFTFGGTELVSSGPETKRWRVSDGALIATWAPASSLYILGATPDGTRLGVQSGHTLALIGAADGAPDASFVLGGGYANDLSFSDDGTVAAVGTHDGGAVFILDVLNRKSVLSAGAGTFDAYVSVSHDGTMVAAAGGDRTVLHLFCRVP